MYFTYTDSEIGYTGKGYEFNDTIRDFLNEMRNSHADVVDPVDLFKGITKKWPRFRGYQVRFKFA